MKPAPYQDGAAEARASARIWTLDAAARDLAAIAADPALRRCLLAPVGGGQSAIMPAPDELETAAKVIDRAAACLRRLHAQHDGADAIDGEIPT